MKKLKILFTQSMMISTGVLFLIAIQSVINHFSHDIDSFEWSWSVPVSIIAVGIFGALPTLFIFKMQEAQSKIQWFVGLLLHFIFTGAVVTVCGYIFNWYGSWGSYLPILVIYVLIYVFVWASTKWMMKNDEKKINNAIKNIRDEE